MTFSLWPRAVIAAVLTLACIALQMLNQRSLASSLNAVSPKMGRIRLTGINSTELPTGAVYLFFLKKKIPSTETQVVTSLSGYSTKGKIIIRGKGKNLTKNNDWDYLFSVKSQKSVIDALKEGIEGKEEPNKKWERKCSLKLISEKPIGQIRGDLAQYSAAKREVESLKEKLAAERNGCLNRKTCCDELRHRFTNTGSISNPKW